MIKMKEILNLEREALKFVKSRYLLSILVSQRIHQLEKGANPSIDVDPTDFNSPKSYYPLALTEIIEGNMDLEQVKS